MACAELGLGHALPRPLRRALMTVNRVIPPRAAAVRPVRPLTVFSAYYVDRGRHPCLASGVDSGFFSRFFLSAVSITTVLAARRRHGGLGLGFLSLRFPAPPQAPRQFVRVLDDGVRANRRSEALFSEFPAMAIAVAFWF